MDSSKATDSQTVRTQQETAELVADQQSRRRTAHDRVLVFLLLVLISIMVPLWKFVPLPAPDGFLDILGAQHAPWFQLGISALFVAAFLVPYVERSQHPARLWPLLIPAFCWFCYAWWEWWAGGPPSGAIRADVLLVVPILLLSSWGLPLVLAIKGFRT